MSIAAKNIITCVLALAIPLVAEFVTATPEGVPGTGFDVLLYEPIDFAYPICIGIIFMLVNLVGAGGRKMAKSISVAIASWGAWFIITFLAVGQLHLMLGGKL